MNLRNIMTRDIPNPNTRFLQPNGLQQFMVREPFIFEQWVQICTFLPEIKEHYWISNHGRVLTTYYKIPYRILTLSIDTKGYYICKLSSINGGYPKCLRINRLVAMAFIPCLQPFNTMVVNHKDGSKLNNFVYNLEWCTHKYNVQHAFYNGLAKPHEGLKGEDSTVSTHTNKEVDQLCRLISQGLYNDKICELMGYDYTVNNQLFINAIRRGEIWTHISCNYIFPKLIPMTFSYSDEFVHNMCKLLVENPKMSSNEIAERLGVEFNRTFTKYVYKIRHRQKRKDISSQYDF